MALVCGKRNRFNFPIVYGQIFLLAKSAVNFFTGALCSLRLLCFQLLRLEQLPLETRAGCREDTGQRGSSVPRHAALPKHFVPFPRSWGQTDRQTSPREHQQHRLPPFPGTAGCACGRAASRGTRLAPFHGAEVGERQEDKRLPQGHGRGEENTCSNAFDPVRTPP